MGFLSKLFKKEKPRVVGVDIGTSAIKVVQLHEEGGQVYLDTYGSLALGPYIGKSVGQSTQLPADKIQDALKVILSESYTSTSGAGMAIPFRSSLVSIIEMPKVPEKQLEKMVPLEARKYIPASLEEVALDWSVVNNDGEGSKDKKEQTKVLLVAIHNAVIEQYQSISRNAGLDVLLYEIEVFATIRSATARSVSTPMLLIDMGAGSTKLYIVEGGVVRLSHTINRGAQDITVSISKSLGISQEEAEMVKREIGMSKDHPHIKEAAMSTLTYLFKETQRMVDNFESKNNKVVKEAVLLGGGAAIKGLESHVSGMFDISTRVARPFDRVQSPSFLNETLSEIGPEFAVALGVGLRGLQEGL